MIAEVRALLAGVRNILRVGRPGNRQEAVVMRDQCNLLFLLCILFPATGGLNVFLNSVAFGVAGDRRMMAMVAVVLALYGLILAVALRWRRTRDDRLFLRRAWLLYTCLGTAWGITIILFAVNGRPDQTVLLLGLAAGVVSTPIISVPVVVAFGFFVPNALLSIYAVSVVMPNADVFSSAAFVSFCAYVTVGIAFTNLTFSGRSRARVALQREIETVGVFLREYEEGSTDWLWQTDRQGRVTEATPRMAEALGLAAEEANGRPLAELLAVAPDGERAEERPAQDLAIHFADRHAFREMLVRRTVTGERRWFRLTGHPVFDEEGAVSGFRGIARDVTASQEASDKVNFLARYDSLTGLLNRRSFMESLDELCRAKCSFALILIDLDSFKGVNDTYGHQVGDRMLQVVASRIQQSIRPQDLGARLGGDEFAVLVMGADGEEGLAVSQRLLRLLHEGFRADTILIQPGCSIGIACHPRDAQDAQRLVMLTDLALYKAKQQGKGQVCLFDDWIEDDYRRAVGLEADLGASIKQEQFALLYQPIVDLESRNIVAVEALVRWNHPERGTIAPGEFIAIAERSNLMEELGRVILRIACRDAASWPSPVQVNVNLSPRQLRSGRFPQILAQALEESGLPPRRLGIEITENVLLDQDERTVAQLDAIRALGAKLILDDFGTGYSSLTYLHKVEVSGIKIDASFTRQLSDRKVAVIYRMIARLAMDLNLYVVAEGVEEPAQVEWLNRNGIRFAQGYLLGRPSPSPPAERVEFLM